MKNVIFAGLHSGPLAGAFGGLLAGLLLLVGGGAWAQFVGKLVYRVDKPGSRLVMTYYQNDTAGHMEAYNVHLNDTIPDSTTIKPQDTILWNFNLGYETHLAYKTWMAAQMHYLGNMEAAVAAAHMHGSVTVTNAGSGTVNGYNCTHYVITSTSQLGTSTRDLWVTGDLGATATVWVVGPYTYFTPGYPHLTKLLAAGATGIVVRSVFSYTGQGVQGVMNLVSVDRTPPKTYFKTPTYYFFVDRTGITVH